MRHAEPAAPGQKLEDAPTLTLGLRTSEGSQLGHKPLLDRSNANYQHSTACAEKVYY